MIHCWNCVSCSELAFAAELCVVQRNCDSLPKLYRLHRISIRCRNWVVCSEFVIRCRNWVFCSELAFAAELCVVQWNCDSLPKLCRLQRISIPCRNWVVCSELAFAAELCVVQRNCDSLPKLSCLLRVCIRCWIGCLQRNSFLCRIGQPASN